MIVVSIALSDIPKESITTSEKNGKKYASFVIDERKQKDDYGNTHSVAMNQSKEERADKKAKVYVGNGKEYIFNDKVKKHDYEQLPDDDNDLPF